MTLLPICAYYRFTREHAVTHDYAANCVADSRPNELTAISSACLVLKKKIDAEIIYSLKLSTETARHRVIFCVGINFNVACEGIVSLKLVSR